MIPWPIAIVCGLYTAVATFAAAAAWKGLHAGAPAAVSLSAAWALASAAIVFGLASMKPWSRRLALWTSTALLVSALVTAVWAIFQPSPQPSRSLIATGMASAYLVVVRYLTRPCVRAWFSEVPGT